MKFITHLELHSQTTRLVEGASHGVGRRSYTGFSPSMTPCSKELSHAVVMLGKVIVELIRRWLEKNNTPRMYVLLKGLSMTLLA